MSGSTLGKIKRERPADGGVDWKEELNAFYCWGCLEYEEIHRRADRTPEKLEELKELLVIEHTECWEFDDPEMARQARRYRKEKKRRENLARQGSASSRQRSAPVLDCSRYLRGRWTDS